MSKKAKKEYLNEIRKRYFLSSKTDKQLILDEFCKNCDYNRKYSIRHINRPQKPPQKSKRSGRPKKYHHTLIFEFLKYRWISSNLVCSKRLKAMIPLWLHFYDTAIPQNLQDLLSSISPATIDGLLHKIKRRVKKFGLSATKPGSLLKKQIPIKTNQWDESRPGFFEADTFAHCGNSLLGSFIYSVNTTDIVIGGSPLVLLGVKVQLEFSKLSVALNILFLLGFLVLILIMEMNS